MRQRRWVYLGLGIVALAGALTLLFGEALREQLLRHVLYELWLWGLRLAGLPFGLVWMLFLIVGSLGVYMTILDLVLQGRARPAPQERVVKAGPVQALAHKIELACRGELGRWNVHRLLSDIAIQWVALHEEIDEGEARRRFQSGTILSDLRDALDLEFPQSATQRGWLWLSGHLPANPTQRKRRLEEISQLTDILERFAGEAYESTRHHR